MTPPVESVETPGQLKLTITRHLDAPRELVWKAWTRHDHIVQWACPKDMTIPFAEMDFSPGGHWRSRMRGPDGKEYAARGEYGSFQEPERLQFTHLWEKEDGSLSPETIVTVSLQDEDGRCVMTFEQSGFVSAEERDSHHEGWSESFDKLEAFMAEHVEYFPRSITIRRVFNAPRETVWNAFTDSDQIAQWWGPRGFTTRVEENDIRPGGRWRYVMVGPDGVEYPATGVFKEVIPLERFSTTDEFGEEFEYTADLPTGIVVTAKFEDQADQTKLTLVIMHPSADERIKHEKMGMVAGWDSSFDCLDDFLAARPKATGKSKYQLEMTLPSDREIRFTRMFDAPRKLVFKAFTTCEYIKQWWGPRDFEMTVCEMDFRQGGEWRFAHRAPDGVEHPFKGVFKEIAPPERLVYTFIYDVAPFNKFEAVETIALEEHEGGTLAIDTVLHPSQESRDGQLCSGMETGAAESMDRLEELLKKMT